MSDRKLTYYREDLIIESDKNDVYLRDIVLEPILKKKAKKAVRLNRAGNEKEAPMFDPDSVERILGISRAKLSFKFDKEGINAVWQAKK